MLAVRTTLAHRPPLISLSRLFLRGAAKNGDVEGLRELLEGGAPVDERGMWESTPLLCAAQYRHENAVRLLLEHGADPGAANERGCTPLLHACVEGLEAAAGQLLERGAPVNVGRAVVYNHARGASAAAAPGEVAPLHLTRTARADCNQLLTPLHAACGNGYASIAVLLLRHGADAGARAAGGDGAPASQQVRAACRFETPLAAACRYGQGAVAELLLQNEAARATVDEADATGRTPLVYACAAGLTDAAVALLEAGARMDGVGNAAEGDTPLLSAARRGLSEVVALLAKRGAPLDQQDSRGRTALFLAAEGGHAACVSALVAAGASPAVADGGGTTPLARAEQLGHDEVASLLRAHTPPSGPRRTRLAPLKGAGESAGDENGDGPIHAG